VHHYLIQLDSALCDVLGARGSDLSLVVHVEEGHIVDMQNEGVGLPIIIEANFPMHHVILQREWERTFLSKFLSSKELFFLVELEFHVLALE